jgi:hypothetical protein
MRLNPNPLDQTVGLAVHFVAVVLLFVIFFQWRRTRVRAPDFAKHRVLLVVGQFLGGGTILFAVLALLLLGTYGGELAQIVVSKRVDLLGTLFLLFTAIGALIAGFGLIGGARWAKSLARIVAFPFSFGWPVGLVVAVYTWWALTPASAPERR